MTANSIVEIDYINWKGERRVRSIRPIRAWFGKTIYHPEPQWLWAAWCLESMEERDFAMAGIHAWRPVT